MEATAASQSSVAPAAFIDKIWTGFHANPDHSSSFDVSNQLPSMSINRGDFDCRSGARELVFMVALWNYSFLRCFIGARRLTIGFASVEVPLLVLSGA